VPEAFFSSRPADLSPNSAYELLTSIVQPRPIAFVSTLSTEGVPNLAPFSFYMVGGTNPPSLMISPVLGAGGRKKDSLRNIEETGEFVVCALHREMADGMNRASYAFDSEESEWDVCGFTPLASKVVKPMRVEESLAQFECRLFQVVEHGTEAGAARYVIGEVVMIHLAQEIWRDGALHLSGIRPISRMGGSEYLDTAAMEVFSLERPTKTP
jgi:flavin reductase (DIM6/NTAB) family NADH-FMN oxidoreductase RutF